MNSEPAEMDRQRLVKLQGLARYVVLIFERPREVLEAVEYARM